MTRRGSSATPEMLILAIEQSSPAGSMAVVRDGEILAECRWGADSRAGLFEALRSLPERSGRDLGEMDLCAVDVGPGSYGALRQSLAAARAIALPRGNQIYALTSAETIAFEVMETCSAERVQVVGDARRGQLWTALYRRQNGLPAIESGIGLLPPSSLRPVMDAILVSPDRTRIAAHISNWGARFLEGDRVPRSGFLGCLAWRKIEAHLPGAPLEPVYLHAAVADASERQ